METFSALLAICAAGNSPVPGEFPAQRPVTRGFDVFFDLRPDKRLSKQSRARWFEMPSHSLWRHRNVNTLASGKYYSNFKSIIFKLNIWNRSLSTICEIGLGWMLQNLINEEWVIRFNGLSGDSGQRGPYSPYKPCNHSLYIGISSLT